MRARLLLAVIVVPTSTLIAQQPGGAAPSAAITAALAASARPHQAHARSASIDQRSDITRTNRSSARILERLRSAVYLGVLGTQVGTAEDVSSVAGGFSPYPMPGGVARAVYAEPGEKVYSAEGTIEKPNARPPWQPTVSSGSGCWWLWVFTGMPVCW